MRRQAGSLVVALLAALFACGEQRDNELREDECQAKKDCDDKVPCTDDLCVVSVDGVRACQHVVRQDLCADGEVCVPDASPPGCRVLAELACDGLAEGAACEPGDACAIASGTCQAGRCAYPVKACEGDACRDPAGCDRKTGECQWAPRDDGAPCNDLATPCTMDACHAGACVEGPAGCGDGDLCKVWTCLPDGSCRFEELTCDAPDDCNDAACEPATGCRPDPRPDGSPCAGPASQCTLGFSCRVGKCVPDPEPDGTPCDDPASKCTVDSCEGGVCKAGPPGCDDGDPCTGATCLSDGTCTLEKTVCDDGDPCTADSCLAGTGCVAAPIVPCCGNSVADGAEDCDAGGTATAGCSDACAFTAFDVETDAVAARAPAVAWSGDPGMGLVAYERQALDGSHVLVLRKVAPDGSLGVPFDLLTVPEWDEVPAITPAVTGIAGGYLVVARTTAGLDVRRLDAAGSLEGGSSLPAGPGGPNSRIGVARAGAGAVLAWDDGPGGNEVAMTAHVGLDGGLSFTAAVALPGTGTPGSTTIYGAACGGDDGGLVMYLARDGQTRHVRAVPVGPDGKPGDVADVGSFAGDLNLGPLCAARPGGFVAVTSDNLVATGGELQVRLWSVLLGPDGKAQSQPVPLAFAEGGATTAIEFCLSGVGALVPLAAGGSVVACPFVKVLGSDITGMRVRSLALDAEGLPDGTFQDVPGQKLSLAMAVAAAPAPGAGAVPHAVADGSILAAWQEGDTVEGILQSASLRGRFLGPFGKEKP